jgi:hypothetical protein
VQYTSEQYVRLAAAVRAKALPAVDRAALIADAMALGRTGALDMADAMRLLTAYDGEDTFTVWQAITDSSTSLSKVLLDGPRTALQRLSNGSPTALSSGSPTALQRLSSGSLTALCPLPSTRCWWTTPRWRRPSARSWAGWWRRPSPGW